MKKIHSPPYILNGPSLKYKIVLIAFFVSYCRLISFEEFKAFEALLCMPDSLYCLAFHLFDKNGSGYIDYGKTPNKLSFLLNSLIFMFNIVCCILLRYRCEHVETASSTLTLCLKYNLQ